MGLRYQNCSHKRGNKIGLKPGYFPWNSISSEMILPSDVAIILWVCFQDPRKKGNRTPSSTKPHSPSLEKVLVILLVHFWEKRRKLSSSSTKSPVLHPSKRSTFTGGKGGASLAKRNSSNPSKTLTWEVCTEVCSFNFIKSLEQIEEISTAKEHP